MDRNRLEALSRALNDMPTRRHVLRAFAGAACGLAGMRLRETVLAKNRKKRKQKARQGLCRKDGTSCKKPGKRCQKRYCLSAPFTIEASWTQPADHDVFLWVPKENEATGPNPYMHYPCAQNNSDCAGKYPFACSSGNVSTTGAEVITIYQSLPGTYEYWIEIVGGAAAGAVAVILRDDNGRVVRQWASPANAGQSRVSWRVFAIDGDYGRVTAIDELINQRMFTAHDPSTNVCPN